MAVPRAPLALRFGPEPGRRLDQALGRLAEPLAPFCPPELIQVRNAFAEPIGAPETLARCIAHLTGRLCPMLERRGLGARRLDLLFERIDGRVEAIRIGTARPVRNPAASGPAADRSARNGRSRLRHRGDDPDRLACRAAHLQPGQPARRGCPAGFVGAGRPAREPPRCPPALSGHPGRERSARALGQARAAARPAGLCDLARALAAAEPAACRRPSRSRPSRCCRTIRRRSSPGAGCAGASSAPTVPSASLANGGGTTARAAAVRDYFGVEDELRRTLLAVPQRRRRGPGHRRSALVHPRRVRMTAPRGTDYAELQVTTHFSFLRGASSVEELFAAGRPARDRRARHHRPSFAGRHRPGARGGQGHRRARRSSAAGST